MSVVEKFFGKTNIIGTFKSAGDESAIFTISGKDYEIFPIVGTETFVSPLKRVKEGQKPLTMKEFLCHPKKSEKRKFKEGDDVMLVLHRIKIIDKENKTSEFVYRLQNALIFSRKLSITDDYEYKGFSIYVSNIEKMIKKEKKGLPLYSLRLSTKTSSKEKILETLETLKENDIIKNSLTLTIYDEDPKELNENYKFLLKEDYRESLKDYMSEEKLSEMIPYEDILEYINKNNNFSISFFMNGSIKNNPLEKYERSIKNNSVFEKSKIPLVQLINEDINAFYSPSTYEFEEGNVFKGKEVYGKLKENTENKYLESPAVISIKNTYSDNDESHYIMNIIVPDLISLRARGISFLRKQKK